MNISSTNSFLFSSPIFSSIRNQSRSVLDKPNNPSHLSGDSDVFISTQSTKKAENEILIKFFLPSDMEIFLPLPTDRIQKKNIFHHQSAFAASSNFWFFHWVDFSPWNFSEMMQFLMQFVHWMMMCLMVYHCLFPQKITDFSINRGWKKSHKVNFVLYHEMLMRDSFLKQNGGDEQPRHVSLQMQFSVVNLE